MGSNALVSAFMLALAVITAVACSEPVTNQAGDTRPIPTDSRSVGDRVAESATQDNRSRQDELPLQSDRDNGRADGSDYIVFQAGIGPTEDFYGIHETTLDAAECEGADYIQLGGEHHIDVTADDEGEDDRLGERRRILMRFDIGPDMLPADTHVIEARLELFHRDTLPPHLSAEPVAVYPMTAPWDEGTGVEPPPPGYYVDGATWLLRLPDVFWATPGGDFDPEPIASTRVSPDVWDWESWDLTNAVREWLAGEPNYGIMLRVRGPAWYSFFSSEFEDDPELRPKLVVLIGPAP